MEILQWPTFDEWWAEVVGLLIFVFGPVPLWVWLPVLVLLTASVAGRAGQHDPTSE